jgi:diguanylate cyclase (GGDEF)-like protein/PAS domain S-box-containing protein
MPDRDAEWCKLLKMSCEGSDHRYQSPSKIIGDGEMADLIRGFNWGTTALGQIDTWSDVLVTTVNLLLASRHPMFLWWGPTLLQFYNDSYQPSIGADKHPGALGRCGVEFWPEIWSVIGPKIEAVMAEGISTFDVNQLVPIRRNGRLEEVFWTYSYNPVRDVGANVQGTLVVCSETTEHVLSERRLRALLEINVDSPATEPLRESQTLLSFSQGIIETVASHSADIPFAGLYFLSKGETLQVLSTLTSEAISNHGQWPLTEVLKSQTSLLVEDVQRRFGNLICEPWPEPVTRAYLLPISIAESCTQAVLVLGISPRLPFDNGYKSFVDLVGSRIASLLQNKVLQMDRVERTLALEEQAAVLAEKAALLDLPKDAIVVRDLDDRVLFWSQGAETLYGWSATEALGKNTFVLLKANPSEPAEAIKAKLLSHGHWEGVSINQTRDGKTLFVNTRAVLQRDTDGTPLRIVNISNDITAEKESEAKLRSLTERLSLATAIAKIGVWEWDLASDVLTWDAAMFEIYGFQAVEQLSYQRWSTTVNSEDLTSVEATLRKVVENKSRGSAEFRITLPDGSVKNISAVEGVVLDEHENVTRVIGVNIDVTEQKKADEALRKSKADIAHVASHDVLTGLPNRILLNDRIEQAIGLVPRHQKKMAILFLDLDGFKHINDSLGHSIGDKLLQSVSQRLVTCIRSSDTVCRQGGDEFIVLLPEVEHPEYTSTTARRLLNAIEKTHSIDGHDLHVSASIGLSVYPDDGLNAETLIKNADTAMYQAKDNDRRGFQFFKQEMNHRAVERHSIERELRDALEREEFALHYQPKIDLRTGEIAGAEALLRWTHPIRGPISPSQFIPVAEDSGLIQSIGNWVLHEACHQVRAWIDAGQPLSTMAVNVSAMQFRNPNFVDELFAILQETGLDPDVLELELTESVLMKHALSTKSALESLRSGGVHLAVDDFGTGYSSLSYLTKFPVDILKIDQSFVREIGSSPSGTSLVMAIIRIGQSLNLRVVAEGIETQEQLAFLRANECDEGQGYYFSRPVTAPQFVKLLQTGIHHSHGRVDPQSGVALMTATERPSHVSDLPVAAL